jgi:hypothetical protein
MDIFAFGNGLDAAIGIGPSVAESTSFYSLPIAGETAGAVVVSNSNSCVRITPRDPVTNAAVTLTEGWVHFRHIPGYNGGGGQAGLFRLRNSALQIIVRIYITSGGDAPNYDFQYWNGSAFVTAFSGVWVNRGTVSAYDVYFKIDAVNGALAAFADGVTVGSVTGINTSGMAQLAFMELTNNNDSGSGFWGWIIAQGGSTIGHLCRMKLPTAAGAHTDFSGTYADVDEYPLSDADFIATETAGDKDNFTGTAFGALPVGNKIKAVGIGARTRNNGAAPSTVRGILTIGGTDYTTADADDVAAGWGPATMLYPVDPSTSAPWGSSLANVNVAFGIESRT